MSNYKISGVIPRGLFILLLGCSGLTHAQNNQWVWGGGDNLWSNAGSWGDAAPLEAPDLTGTVPGTIFVPPVQNNPAIMQSAGQTTTVANDYSPTFLFDSVIVRFSHIFNIDATFDISQFSQQLNVSRSGVVNQSGTGILIAQSIALDDVGAGAPAYNMNGGSITLTGSLSGNNLNNFNFGAGGNGLNVQLSVGGTVNIDNVNNNPFTVGSGSTLQISENTHTFADGLVLDGGTFGTGNNAAAVATLDGSTALTLNGGSTIDFSINGNVNESDTWITSAAGFTLGAGSYDLIVDAVSGSIEALDGDGLGGAGTWDIFTWTSNGPSPAEFAATTWNISVTENTRLGSTGTVEYITDGTSGRIFLSGFTAQAIPEPSTGMLLGVGAVVMLLRRRVRRG